jgi:hypothetical protein
MDSTSATAQQKRSIAHLPCARSCLHPFDGDTVEVRGARVDPRAELDSRHATHLTRTRGDLAGAHVPPDCDDPRGSSSLRVTAGSRARVST